MNGFFNPIKSLWKKRTENPAPPPPQQDNNDILSIPCEHSNDHYRQYYLEEENEDDYFVYRLDPNDDKWPNSIGQNLHGQRFRGPEMSDTITNSKIHVFPDRQDLVNPSLNPHLKYRNNIMYQNLYNNGYYNNGMRYAGNEEQKSPFLTTENAKDERTSRILPTSILMESCQSIESNLGKGISAAKIPENKGFGVSPGYQTYSSIGNKASNPVGKKNMEDLSAIYAPKKIETIMNLDESDDVNFAQVIKTLEKNIERAKAVRKNYHKSTPNNSKGQKLNLLNMNPQRKQEDTLSLDQSSSVVLEHPAYVGEPEDLRARFLRRNSDSSRTIYYSFASTEKQNSGIMTFDKSHTNGQYIAGGVAGGNKANKLALQNFPMLMRIEEETSSAVKTQGKQDFLSSEKGYNLDSSPQDSNRGFSSNQNRFSGAATFGNINDKRMNTRTGSGQMNPQTERLHRRNISEHTMPQAKGQLVAPKFQPSDNYILCINCNDLLPSSAVDRHSVYCNESMIATEDLTTEVMLETQTPQVSLERCNLKLKKLKTLLEKNVRNLKGQVHFQTISFPDPHSVFSSVDLALKIIEEVIKNDKALYKLRVDISTLQTLKKDLEPFIDIVLANIIANNLDISIQLSKTKEKALELTLKKEEPRKVLFQTDTEPNANQNNPFTLKLEFERLGFNSLHSPHKATSKMSPHSQKPSTLENYGQSTNGSTFRVPLTGDIRDWIGGSTH